MICLIGNGTAWREMVDWALRTAHELRKGICGLRSRDSRERVPPLLGEVGAPVAPNMTAEEVIKAIECAAVKERKSTSGREHVRICLYCASLSF